MTNDFTLVDTSALRGDFCCLDRDGNRIAFTHSFQVTSDLLRLPPLAEGLHLALACRGYRPDPRGCIDTLVRLVVHDRSTAPAREKGSLPRKKLLALRSVREIQTGEPDFPRAAYAVFNAQFLADLADLGLDRERYAETVLCADKLAWLSSR